MENNNWLLMLLDEYDELSNQIKAITDEEEKSKITLEMLILFLSMKDIDTKYIDKIKRLDKVSRERYIKMEKQFKNNETYLKLVNHLSIESTCDYNNDYEYLKSIIVKYVSIHKDIFNANDIFQKRDLNLKWEDCLEIIKSFLKYLGDEYYNIFIKYYQCGQIHVVNNKNWQEDDRLGFTMILPHLKKSYVFIQNLDPIKNMFFLIHEFGHVFYNEISNYQNDNRDNYHFAEITPIFLEMVFTDYMRENNLFYEDIYRQAKIHIISDITVSGKIYDDLCIRQVIENYCEMEKYNGEQKKALYNNKLKIKQLVNNSNILLINKKIELKDEIPSRLRYITNRLIATLIYNVYLQNKNYAMNITKYLALYNEKTPFENFADLDIDISYDELLEMYSKYYNDFTNSCKNEKESRIKR